MRNTIIILAALLAATAGCVPSYPVTEGEFDRYWQLTDMSSDARPAAPKANGGFRMPRLWVIHSEEDETVATDSLRRAMAELREGVDEIEVAVSTSQTADMVNLLRDIRLAMKRTEEMLDTAGRASRNQWAAALAAALVKVETTGRYFLAEPNSPAAAPVNVFGTAGGPMLQMISGYIDEQAQNGMLDELTPAEKRRLQDAMCEMTVQAGFEVAGKAATRQVRRDVIEMMRTSNDPAALERDLTALLTRRISAAPPARGDSKQQIVRNILKWAPKALALMEAILSQWDRMEGITVELLERRGRRAAAVTVAVKPGQPVRIANVVTGMPTVVLEGTCRLIVQPDAAGTGETVISFQPGKDGGAVELRYEGAIFSLVRLFAIPVAGGPLREIRVSSSSPPQGRQLLNIALLSEAADAGQADPRRMTVVQNTSLKHLVRDAFEVRTVTKDAQTVFNYVTPTRRYTYVTDKKGT